MKLFQRGILGGVIFAAILALSLPSYSQSFSIDTGTTQAANLYSYTFTLNYDLAGQDPLLTDSIWDWNFYVDPSLDAPTAIATPTGWEYTYDPNSGQFDFFTEGPTGFGNGDFGDNVIQAGQSLSGFGLTTEAAPDSSIAFATDEQYYQDATLATLPTTLPATGPSSVPEPSTVVPFGTGSLILGGLVILARRRTRSVKA